MKSTVAREVLGVELSIGTWGAITGDGLWASPFGDDTECQIAFKRKKDLVADIKSACLDAWKTPLVKKNGPHRYIYRVKNCDTGKFDEEFILTRVTAENREYLNSLLEAFTEDT